MEIAIIADDKKKEIMTEFCIAYCGILCKHSICATATTGKYISEATGLKIERMMAGSQGGAEQIASRIAYNEIDMVIFLTDPHSHDLDEDLNYIARLCDQYTIPFATNAATAEMLIQGLARGDLDWREIVNPKSNTFKI